MHNIFTRGIENLAFLTELKYSSPAPSKIPGISVMDLAAKLLLDLSKIDFASGLKNGACELPDADGRLGGCLLEC